MSYIKSIIELKPSKLLVGQVGLFVNADLNKGSIVADHSCFDETYLMSWDEYNNLDVVTKNKINDFCCKYEKGITAPQNINNITIPWHINHSCEPNVYCNSLGDYVLAKNVLAGDELTIDVETLMEKPVMEFDCVCNSINCRKKIKI